MHRSRANVDSRSRSLATRHRFRVAFASYIGRVLLVAVRDSLAPSSVLPFLILSEAS